MHFNFHFGVPPMLEWLFSLLFQLIALGGIVVGGAVIVKRLKAAWQHGGIEPLPKEASRKALLDRGMPIVSLSDGLVVGLAKDVILDMKSRYVVGFRARGRYFWQRRFLPFEFVRGVGKDVITVDAASALMTAEDAPILAELAQEKHLGNDCEVMTEGGTKVGRMSWRNLWFDRETGRAEIALKAAWELEVRVPLTTVVSAHCNLVIVNAEAESLIQQQAQEQVARTKEQAIQAWERIKTSAQETWDKLRRKDKGVNL